MKYVIAVPDKEYYLWQVLVQINNFRKYDIEKDAIYVFAIFNNRPSKVLESFITSKELKSKFYIIPDRRPEKAYSCSLRSHIMAEFYRRCNVPNEPIFFTDPDVIFTRKPNFSQFENDEKWYLSNTRSYTGVDYIKSKSPDLFLQMCKIVGISPEVVERNDANSGGAQYIMKNLTSEYWNKCYEDGERLYRMMKRTSAMYSPKSPIQAWTADMWAVLWNGWYFNHDIEVTPRLDFAWANHKQNSWDKYEVFHNAGVTVNDGKHFSKIHYQLSPFNKETPCEEQSCSFNYVKEIKETEINFPNLIF